MLGACRRPTLLQSWQYAAAVARTEGLAADFGIIRFGSKPIGLVQVQRRRLPLGLAVCSIHRGPVFIYDEIPGEMLKLVLGMLRRRYLLLRGRPLTFHPELPDTPANRDRLHAVGFRRREDGYRTHWIDLSPEPAALRAGLSGTWRNQLGQAERSGLEVEIDRDGHHRDWLLELHAADMAARGYRGPSPAVIRVLYEVSQGEADRPLILRAVSRGRPVAGALFLRHGSAATYQIGWTAPEGRPHRAQNLLLWRAVLELRAKGTKWLDLGGFNVRTPGIEHFKAGLGGSAVTLVGGYV
ncbi:lipid II:glycine glycyltransferase FemX [Arenibaculum pallidiluteum]|uniref:lipid II:glycine glycyltransferase FemX n=1 Tax=Arenibaculum pallidiluteum TaxID=2812559 RepID=UPI001A96FFC9|nr:GNAT family N-acetyltransferase [Arenibaculum pallidiluteum]